MLKEFKDFINKGNVVTIAVGLVMALFFQKIVQAFLDGVINPIISAIFGKGSFTEIGFKIRTLDNGEEIRISLGLVIDAAITFVAVAFILFLIVKAYNKYFVKVEEAHAGPTEIDLLTQIRDELAKR